MTAIQFLLIGGVVVIFCYYFFQLRNALFDFLVFGGFAIAAVFFICFPSYTNVVANELGVGRGADLLFYLCILLFLFVSLKLLARMRRLEQQITALVRHQAKVEGVYISDTSDGYYHVETPDQV